MVDYDVIVNEQGDFVRMSIQEIVATGMETVRIRAMHGHYYEIRVETLVQTDREETIRRRNAQLARERRERYEDPDYRLSSRRPPPPPLPKIIHHDEVPPVEEMLPRRNPDRHRFIHRNNHRHLIPVIPEDDERLTVPEPQLRNEEAENWRKQADDYREKLEMATEEIHELQEMLKANQRKMVLGMIELMKLTKQKKE